jgi:hypothetical protein
MVRRVDGVNGAGRAAIKARALCPPRAGEFSPKGHPLPVDDRSEPV